MQRFRENMAMLMTPPGPAAIAVVRLAGPGVAGFLQSYFSKVAHDGHCVHGILHDESGREIDDPVVVSSADGTIADINVHGGAWVVQAVLNLAERGGFERRVALEDAGTEFEREILAAIPLARTELALRVLLAQPQAWESLLQTPHAIDEILADRSLCYLLHPPLVAIIGAPNVGKSTLANQLFAQERSITADMPGTTRDWVGEIANIDGLAVMLVDTPGLRETVDVIEQEAIELSRGELERADLVVRVLDGNAKYTDPGTLAAYWERESIIVINKIDLPRAWDWSGGPVIETVASTGKGVNELRRAILRHFGCLDLDIHRPRVWTQRQRELLLQPKVSTYRSSD
jgi:tRNA modification GTPase